MYSLHRSRKSSVFSYKLLQMSFACLRISRREHLAAFNSGADFHAATAARVFGVPVGRVAPALRSRAKAVNFGIVYGQQAFGRSGVS